MQSQQNFENPAPASIIISPNDKDEIDNLLGVIMWNDNEFENIFDDDLQHQTVEKLD